MPATKKNSLNVTPMVSEMYGNPFKKAASFGFCLAKFSTPGVVKLYHFPHGFPFLTVNEKMSSDDPNQPGLVITVTESIRSFLLSASNDHRLSKELRELALTLSSAANAPYKQIRSIWMESAFDSRPGLIPLFSGSNFVFTSPKPREKSEELKERLRKLKELAERKEYQELVKDITPKKDLTEPFSTYKDQIGFGLHVALTMFTGYLVGYFAFRALFNHSPIMNSAGGILGLVFGMLLETFLFIIRTSEPNLKSPSSTSRLKKNQ